MKLKNVLSTSALLLVVLVSGCNKDLGNASSDLSENSAALASGVSATEKSAALETKGGSLAGVNLGVAGDFVILSKTGITDVYKSAVTGDIGSSPITGAAILLKCVNFATIFQNFATLSGIKGLTFGL